MMCLHLFCVCTAHKYRIMTVLCTFYEQGELYIIDVSQSVDLDHPKA